MDTYHNRTRKVKSIPIKLLSEGKFYLIPIYYLMLTSTLAFEGINNSGSYQFADHIYVGKARGKFVIGKFLDAILLRLPSAQSFRMRYIFAKDEIYKFLSEHIKVKRKLKILAAPSGLARELFEVADELKARKDWTYKKLEFHCADLDHTLLEKLQKMNHKKRHTFFYIKGDLLRDQIIVQNTYDMVISMGFTEFLDDSNVLVYYSLARKWLRQRGKLVTSGMLPHSLSDYLLRNIGDLHTHYRSVDDLRRLARKAGFRKLITYQDKHKLQSMLIAEK